MGRPEIKVKNGMNAKTRFILNSTSWPEYFNELDVVLKDDAAIDRLLRFAIWNSKCKGYHRDAGIIQKVNAPMIGVLGAKNGKQPKEVIEAVRDIVGIRGGSGRGWGNAKGSGWRGRGRGNMTMQRGRGRGRGSDAKPYNSQRQNAQMPKPIRPPTQPGMPQQSNQSSNAHNAQPGMPVPNKQNNVNKTQNNGAGQKKLSKSQRQKLRKRLAKERAMQQQQINK